MEKSILEQFVDYVKVQLNGETTLDIHALEAYARLFTTLEDDFYTSRDDGSCGICGSMEC